MRLELTWRGLALGGLITLAFTAANIYLGLKAGLTFATSIPAAVISMAVLRAFRNATIYENNIVQTVASAAGTLSSIIFVLPGLLLIGWWQDFPYWQSFLVCLIGGILGVMYSVPLRRALVTESDLPYPEGVAAAEVLKVGSESRDPAADAKASADSHAGLLAVVWGSVVSAAFYAVVQTRVFIDEFDQFFRVGNGATGFGVGLSLALVGAGHLVGLSVGVAMFFGILIAWGAATPILSAMHPAAGAAATVALDVWRHQVRFIGAGTIGIAAIWSIGRLLGPVLRGLRSALAASAKRRAGQGDALPRTERDIPIAWIGILSAVCLLPLGLLLAFFLQGTVLTSMAIPLVLGALVYIVIAGFFVAAVCGYMAGLIGSSNSPVSGLAILTVLGASLLLVGLGAGSNAGARPALVAFALFITAVVLCVATISNDNLQDLKTGQLVDATPWRQQVALIVGCVFGAAVIPPFLNIINQGNGFVGQPHPVAPPGAIAVPAPQATLISQLALGVISGTVPWNLIAIGVVVGLVVITIDEALGKAGKMRLPPLAVGIGIYLPAGTTAAVVVGAVCGWLYNRWARGRSNADMAKQLGVLLASGLIVGESLVGVVNSGLVAATKNPQPIAVVGDSFAVWANWLGLIGFAATLALLYRWIRGVAARLA